MIKKITESEREFVYNSIETAVMRDIEKYKFFINYYKMRPIKNKSFVKCEYISIVKGRLQGYFAFLFDKINRKVINIEVMAFDETAVLTRDFMKFCKYLDENFENFELSIIPESPAYRIASKCFEKYGLTKIGTLKSSILLRDKKRYSLELWEKKR